MKRFLISILIFPFLTISCNAQKLSFPNIEKVYLDKTDTTKNYYTIIQPSKLPIRGFMILVSGFGESADEVLRQTDLPTKLSLNGILTIIPTFQDGLLSFGVDSLSQQSFNDILKDVTKKNNLTNKKFYVGGFSIGGSCAIKFAENSTITPTAIFAIDPPLDFERFYNSSKRDLRISKLSNPNQENVYMINRIENIMGGTPQRKISNYYKVSPYSFSDTTQTAIKKLIKIPIRIYSEPDINWWLKERGADATSMNVTDCSAMINELNKLGNNNATLITTQNRGYRKPNNKRHPHSWSIVENDDLIKWLVSQE